MAELKLQNMKMMSDGELEIAIANCFDYSPETTPVDRLAILQEAQFYTRELERRNDAFIAKRDLWLEITVVVLITLELCLGFYEGAKQSISATKEQQALSDLQSNMALTAKVLSGLEKTTEKMNEGVQKELDLYYEPSVLVTYVFQHDSDFLEIYNYGRTGITVYGIKIYEQVCSLEKPMRIASGVKNDLGSWSVVNQVMNRVISSGGTEPLTIYFRTENGREFRHQVLVDRVPVQEGHGAIVLNQNTEPAIWDRELAQASVKKCPR